MLKIITNIPLFVWPLFFILLIGGLKARKTSWVPLKALILIPIGFFIWSFYSFFGKYAGDFSAGFLWLVFLGLGFCVGFFHVQRLKLRFDKKKKMIEMPASWIPLVLSMSVFATKFSIGMMRSIWPHFQDSMLFLGLELFSTAILGIILGRAASCFFRVRSSALEIVEQ